MIKLLADENFPMASVQLLVDRKFDVLSISKSYSSISDVEVIRLANSEGRVILTFDRDFGQLIFREGIIPKFGVFYFRLENFSPTQPAQIVMSLLEKQGLEIANFITVIEENFIRQKKF